MVNTNPTRLAAGFRWGIVATITMSILLIIGYVSGLAPMPQPIPKAVVTTVLGNGIPKPLIIGAHLLYGAIAGVVFVAIAQPATLEKGLSYGIVLWLIMDLLVLPFIGWGIFGTAITPRIAVATLVLHLVYGTTIGLVADRHVPRGFPRLTAGGQKA
jgi:Na+/H+-translocating membrane pyrophosphatase